jgi:hypothetical protein
MTFLRSGARSLIGKIARPRAAEDEHAFFTSAAGQAPRPRAPSFGRGVVPRGPKGEKGFVTFVRFT